MNGDNYEANQQHNLSKAGKPLLVKYDLKSLSNSLSKEELAYRPETMWRYGDFYLSDTLKILSALAKA